MNITIDIWWKDEFDHKEYKNDFKKFIPKYRKDFLGFKERMKTYIIAHFNSKIKYREYRFSTNETKNLKPTDINAKRTDINIKPEDIHFFF